jgi:7-cyano-7-deazaguanine synthase in queuosine biosynthesis
MVSGYPEKRGIILTGVDVMREMGYRTIVVGVEDIKNYHYLFECERIERSRSYWDEYEKKYGVRVIFGCENLSKTDVVRKVLSVMRPEYIITCLDDNWSPSNPRCGKCVGCVDEFKILEKLGLEDPNFYF